MEKPELSYKEAGVDIAQANALVSDIREIAARTRRPGMIGNIGGFGALFEIPSHYKQPVLVSGTDGVGTKLKLAITLNRHDTIGIDLVAMCVNDVACLGAEPLFFLDYFATGKLNPLQARAILTGIAKGCEIAGAALIGGETAEMPGMYQGDDYDLAGFCVGVVEKNQILDGTRVQVGDVLIALASSGPHSNGYSLARKVIERTGASLETPFERSTLGETLLTPTKIYVPALKALQKSIAIHAVAHITGGGLGDNVPRVLPPHTRAAIDTHSWAWPPIFEWLQKEGRISVDEMRRAFNLGVGLVICVGKQEVDHVLDVLRATGETPWVIGQIEHSDQRIPTLQCQ